MKEFNHNLLDNFSLSVFETQDFGNNRCKLRVSFHATDSNDQEITCGNTERDFCSSDNPFEVLEKLQSMVLELETFITDGMQNIVDGSDLVNEQE